MGDYDQSFKKISEQTMKILVEGVFNKYGVDDLRRKLSDTQKKEMRNLVKSLEAAAEDVLTKYKKTDS